MSEPHETATTIDEVVPGVYHWQIHDSRIGGGISSSHAVTDGETSVLIDPVSLERDALETLPHPKAILLTATCHQRSAWHYRDELGTEVWLPEDAPEADQTPDRRYADGDLLPGGLRARRTPGPQWSHYSFVRDSHPGVVFCADLLVNAGERELQLVPPEYQEDPAEARHSVELLLDLPFSVLCLDHGAPIVADPKGAIEALLEATRPVAVG